MASKKQRGFYLSSTELLHIAISVVTVSLAFTLFPIGSFSPERFVTVLLTVGTAFILHELGHKYVAIRYGALAEYRAFTWGLFLALGLAFLTNGSLIFAAPGAVFIFGKAISREENGRIALAGPLVNLGLALAFFVLGSATHFSELVTTGIFVNAFLGFFNLIPIPPMDGSKVFEWNKLAWATVFLGNIALLTIFS